MGVSLKLLRTKVLISLARNGFGSQSISISTSLVPNIAISHSKATIIPTEGLLDLWLHGKSPHTQRYYRREALKFSGIVNKPIESITLADVQGYPTALHQSSLAISSVARAITAIKSLFTFAYQKTGLLKANPAGAVTLPKAKDSLAERILPEWVV